MLIYFVFFVSMNIQMISMEDIIIKIEINKKEARKCNVAQKQTLDQNSNFTLKIKSEYFIVKSIWNRQYMNQFQNDRLENFTNWNLSITYERRKGSEQETNTFKYIYSHFFINNQHPKIVQGPWNFTFDLLEHYDPWSINSIENNHTHRWCSTTVNIEKRQKSRTEPSANPRSDKSVDSDNKALIIVLAFVGALLLAQTSYIITEKIRGRKPNKNSDKDPITPKSPKIKRGSKTERNIAERPPQPLPPDEVIKDQPGSPVSPRPKRHNHYPSAPPIPEEDSCKCHPVPLMQKESYRKKSTSEGVPNPAYGRRCIEGPLVPKQSYRHKASDNSDDAIRSPDFGRHRTRLEGPLAPKQSFKNRALDNELRSPGLGRRHEGPLVPKKPYKKKLLENSLEELRSPDFSRRREGSLVPKQSYINKVLDDSVEEIRTPSFAGRQTEAMLVQLPPKVVNASKSYKNPIPVPRRTSSPPTPPEKPPIYPSPSKEPAPPLHPKKVTAVFPCQQETGRPQDTRRFSDEEWQYEQLQPASYYLN